MIKWIRTSRLSIKKSLSGRRRGGSQEGFSRRESESGGSGGYRDEEQDAEDEAAKEKMKMQLSDMIRLRALSGRLKFTVRRHKFNQDSLSLRPPRPQSRVQGVGSGVERVCSRENPHISMHRPRICLWPVRVSSLLCFEVRRSQRCTDPASSIPRSRDPTVRPVSARSQEREADATPGARKGMELLLFFFMTLKSRVE